ncbi:outer membrane lipid asymmetry maintenance protein MlaD [Acinetobacter amyesii]|uniref:outer membrane lipid asymmetry maintenance protein MlaD n=1 Tax=Acinetobacter amyesii TaxID=2942470 RepID=UPI0020BD91A9|nr:outer membrane lipid asymmetry maintenance protein MlaD [Acinetobacter amyesii]MCL6240406.1 outer membrane lipid asymmetry maintenance protein MlaD [Acinetobacter amyesii]
MKSRTSELAVGFFVILFAIAIFFLAMRVSGLVGNNIEDSYELTATFENVNGIKPRAKVTLSGVKVGQVESLKLDPVTRLVTAHLIMDGSLTSYNAEQLKEVQKNALEELRYTSDYEAATPAKQKEMEQQLIANMKSITNIDEDAYIMVATNGLLGEKYLKIVPGGGVNFLKRGDQIGNTQGTMEIEDLVSKFVTGGAGNKSDNTADAEQKTEAADTTMADEPAFVE